MDAKGAVLRNQYGGLYQEGKAFTATEWTRIMDIYCSTRQIHGKCTVPQCSSLWYRQWILQTMQHTARLPAINGNHRIAAKAMALQCARSDAKEEY